MPAPNVAASAPQATQAAPAVQAANVAASAPPTIQAAPVVATITLAGQANTTDSSEVNPALMGRSYSGSIMVGGFKLPLLPGNWVVLASQALNVPGPPANMSGVGYFLGRIDKKRLVGAIRIVALRSKDKPGSGLDVNKACDPANPYSLHSVVDTLVPFDSQACWLISSFYTPTMQQWADRAIKMPPLERAAAGDLTAKGVTYPQDMLKVQFMRSEKWGALEVSYLFSSEAEGITSNTVLSAFDADWFPRNIGRYPEKKAFVEKTKAWATGFWPTFQAAFVDAQ